MKRNRIIWALLWAASLVGISFYGGAISYGFFIVLTLVPVISLLYLWCAYIFFHIYQKLGTRNLVVNQTIPFSFRLVNEYWIAFVGVRVKFFSSFSTINGLSDETEYELLPGSEIKRETTIICKYRGKYDVGIKTVEFQDFFRLFKITYKNRECLSAIIKPELVQLQSLSCVAESESIKDTVENATELDVLTRTYVIGDDLRQVHWALSAKNNELVVRTRIGQERSGVGIVIDTMRYEMEQHLFLPVENKVLEAAIAVTFYLANQGISVFEYHIEENLKRLAVERINQFEYFYDELSQVQFDDRRTQEKLFMRLNETNELYSYSLVFLLLQQWTKEAEEYIHVFSQSGGALVVFLVGDNQIEAETVSGIKNVKLIMINPEDDLREVLS